MAVASQFLPEASPTEPGSARSCLPSRMATRTAPSPTTSSVAKPFACPSPRPPARPARSSGPGSFRQAADQPGQRFEIIRPADPQPVSTRKFNLNLAVALGAAPHNVRYPQRTYPTLFKPGRAARADAYVSGCDRDDASSPLDMTEIMGHTACPPLWQQSRYGCPDPALRCDPSHRFPIRGRCASCGLRTWAPTCFLLCSRLSRFPMDPVPTMPSSGTKSGLNWLSPKCLRWRPTRVYSPPFGTFRAFIAYSSSVCPRTVQRKIP